MRTNYDEVLLFSLFTGAIPFDDPRADPNRFRPETLVEHMGKGNEAFDRAVAGNLITRCDKMTSDQLAWAWRKVNDCCMKADHAVVFDDALFELEGMLDNELVEARSDDNWGFVDTVADIIGDCAALRKKAIALLKQNVPRIDSREALCRVFEGYRDADLRPPRWLLRLAVVLLRDTWATPSEIEDLALECPDAKPVALVACRKRLARLQTSVLLDLGIEDPDFELVWFKEIKKRKKSLLGLLVELKPESASAA